MLDAVLATVGWVVVAWLPGILLCDLLRPSAGPLRNAALGALLGLGETMVVGQLWSWAHVSIRPATVLPLSLGAPILAWGVGLAMRRPRDAGRWSDTTRPKLTNADRYWLVGAVVVGLVLWSLAIPSLSAVMPFIDGSHHGLFAHRIETLHTLDANRVLASSPEGGAPSYNYYPLALHLCVALISAVTGVAVNQVFVVGVVLAATVLFPLGIFVVVRRLLPDRRNVAGIAAVLAASFPWFPFSPLLWGAVPLIIAMSQVPAAVDALTDARHAGRPALSGLAIGLAGYGVFEVHNTEVVTIAIFGAIFVAFEWRNWDAPARRAMLRMWAVAGVVDLLLVIPDLHTLSAGVNERTGNLGHGHGSGLSPLEWLVGAGNPALLVLTVIGLVIALRRRWLLPWACCLLATTVLFATTLPSPAILPWVTVAWYSSASRLSYMFGFFEPVFAALSAALIVEWARGRARVKSSDERSVFVLAPIAALAVAVALLVAPIAVIFVRSAYQTRSLVGTDQRAAFTWLAAHTRPGERVLNQFTDDSAWMETLDDVTPVFSIDPLSLGDPQHAWGDRWYLLQHAGRLQSDPRAQAAAKAWDVRFVYVGSKVFTHQSRHLSASELRASPAYRQVWHHGSATVFEIVTG